MSVNTSTANIVENQWASSEQEVEADGAERQREDDDKRRHRAIRACRRHAAFAVLPQRGADDARGEGKLQHDADDTEDEEHLRVQERRAMREDPSAFTTSGCAPVIERLRPRMTSSARTPPGSSHAVIASGTRRIVTDQVPPARLTIASHARAKTPSPSAKNAQSNRCSTRARVRRSRMPSRVQPSNENADTCETSDEGRQPLVQAPGAAPRHANVS